MDFLLLQAKNLKPHRNIDIIFLLFLSFLKNYHLKKIHDSFSTRINSTICSAFNSPLNVCVLNYMLHMPCALRPSCADVLYVITCFTCLLAFDSSVPSFLMSLMCPHFLCALRAFIFYVLFVLPLFYVPCGFIFFILLHLPYITLIPSGTFGFLNEKDNPILSVSQLGDFSNDQMKFISFAQGIRTMSLQCCYNIFDVETALQQPYYSQLWHADCHYADFNWSLRQGIILVKVLRTRLYSSSFSRWFREVFRSG